MTTLREAAQQALEALEEYQAKGAPFWACDAAVAALRAALAEPVQEPVAWWIPKAEQFSIVKRGERPFAKAWEPLFTLPPERKPLPTDDLNKMIHGLLGSGVSPGELGRARAVARATERAHGIGEEK